MSTASSRARRGGGRHFPVGGGGGRWRHVPVVDTGCGCRPRRPRQLLMSLPSFLRPSLHHKVPRSTSSSHSSSTLFPSSSSAASIASFSSSSAATFTTTYSSSNYKQPTTPAGADAAAPVKTAARRRRKKRYENVEKMAEMGIGAEEEEVGMAVEKESSDPRADFRESMVQMVVEMGMCGWDDLRCMLRRLLALNAPRHHAAILTAFAEVCAQLAAPPPPPAHPAPPPPPPPPQPAYHHYHYYQYHHY